MAKIRIVIDLERKEYDDLHKLMNLSLQSEDNITIYQVAKDSKKQPFYRYVIQEGIKKIYSDFQKEKEKYEHES